MRTPALFALLASSVVAGTAAAEIVTREVPYTHNGTELTGYLAYDDAREGKLAGVLVVHEWWGLNDYPKARARQLAELGYVAFAVDMYGVPPVTTAQEAGALAGPFNQDRTAMRERALAGLKVLHEQPNVDAGRTAAIGYCFGGTTCLELARAGAPLRSVVSFHGNLSNPNPADDRNIRAKVLVATGGADPMVPAEQRAEFARSMEEAGVDYMLLVYGDAKHAFTNPDADRAGMDAVGYQQAADRRSWEHMKLFLHETLAPGRVPAPAHAPTGD